MRVTMIAATPSRAPVTSLLAKDTTHLDVTDMTFTLVNTLLVTRRWLSPRWISAREVPVVNNLIDLDTPPRPHVPKEEINLDDLRSRMMMPPVLPGPFEQNLVEVESPPGLNNFVLLNHGKSMKTKDRDRIILATKVCGPSHGWIKGSQRGEMTALDRHNIRRAVEESLTRLQTDYIDLYQTHWPDHGTGFDETMETLDDLVREGYVRIVGCSNEDAWGLMKSIETSNRLGTVRYQTIQNNFSLNNRRFEDALSKICEREGVSLIPYSPLGGGVLSGKYQNGAFPEGARFSAYANRGGRHTAMAQRFVNEKSLAATARYMEIAKGAGISPVTLATAWSKQHSFVA